MGKSKPLAFIDIETTGLSIEEGHEIIEIAILKGDISYYVKVTPQHIERANPKALEINKYNPTRWFGAISPRKAANETAQILQGCRIVAHNPSFDMGFLRDLWDLHNIECYVDYRYIDTIVLSHEHLESIGCRSLSLDNIRRFMGWSRLGSHTALADVEDTRRLYNTLCRATVFHRLYWWGRWGLLCWLGSNDG